LVLDDLSEGHVEALAVLPSFFQVVWWLKFAKLMMEGALAVLHGREVLSYVVLCYFNAAGAHPGGLIGEGHHNETRLIPLVLHKLPMENVPQSKFMGMTIQRRMVLV
jgi:hypothetical protein